MKKLYSHNNVEKILRSIVNHYDTYKDDNGPVTEWGFPVAYVLAVHKSTKIHEKFVGDVFFWIGDGMDELGKAVEEYRAGTYSVRTWVSEMLDGQSFIEWEV
jgi:hypothetical protein